MSKDTEKVEVFRTDHIIARGTIMEIRNGVTLDEWKAVGMKLRSAEHNVQWLIGAWWNYGHKKWGREAEDFLKLVGVKATTAQDYAWVCNSVKSSIRIEDLSFLHHRITAPLPEAKQKRYLKQAKDEKLSVSKLRKLIRENENPPKPIAPGKYRVILADPPWEYHVGHQHGRADSQATTLGTHYDSLTLEQICSMDVKTVAAENAVLFLWATSPNIFEAKDVLDAWGFTYKSMFIWDKVKHNVGSYNSVRHEILLIATKGSCMPDCNKLFDSVQSIERTEHSRKPEFFREIIDTMYTQGPKLELFARSRHEGWTAHGNDTAIQCRAGGLGEGL